LIVLTSDNDPFYAGMPYQKLHAEWFAGMLDRFGLHLGAHIRRVHYRMITAPDPITLPGGEPYLNTETHWSRLIGASAAARILGLVDVESMVDRRNDPAIENAPSRQAPLSPPHLFPGGAWYELPNLEPADVDTVTGGLLTPSMLGYDFDPVDARPVMIELWVEKSTMADILKPLCQELHINYVEGIGFESITQTVTFLRRAQQYGKAAHILYVSDFDPGGVGMPIAVARQVQFWLEQLNIDVEVSVDTTVLTHDQCVKYKLPRSPIKGTDTRKSRFEARYGEGATELDALEALHPGELAKIIRQAVERFIDRRLVHRLARLRHRQDGPAGAVDDAWITGGGPWLENRMRDLVGLANAYATEQAERIHQIMEETGEHLQQFTAAAADLGDQAREIGMSIDVELPERPEPEITGPEPDVLFDSRRHWLDQLAAFKARLNGVRSGRPTEQEK
jgi:hypothetical protein